MAFSMAAEIERDLISARTTKVLRARKASGLPLGRQKERKGANWINIGRKSKLSWPMDRPRGSSLNATTPHRQPCQTGSRNPNHEFYGGFGTFVGLDPMYVQIFR